MARVRSRQSAPKQDDILVFAITKESECAECAVALGRGNFLKIEHDRPLCMACADLGHLLFLPSGDAALTRRARKYSTLSAVVLRFSRARKRYERQGILVEEAALERAERDCLADADARAAARRRAAERRAQEDTEHAIVFARHIGERYPCCPPAERTTIARHACRRHSGRVGRSAEARQLDPAAIDLAVRAHVRHAHTRYDELLVHGQDRDTARAHVAADVQEVLDAWRKTPHSPDARQPRAS